MYFLTYTRQAVNEERRQRTALFRVCLVGENFLTVSVTSNFQTHAWSIKYSKKITNYIV